MFTAEQKTDLINNFAKADLNQIADKKLQQRAKALRGKQGGFTLLELLVVVGILAIIGGAMISSFGGQEENAAQGTATNAIAALENGFSIYETVTGSLPNNLESLACIPYNATAPYAWATNVTTVTDVALAVDAAAPANTAFPFGGVSDLPGVGGGMGKKLADKMTLTALPVGATDALAAAGITQLRYAAAEACDSQTTGTTAVTFTGGEEIGASQALQDITIPNHAFEDPRPGGAAGVGRNRGRGFSVDLGAGAAVMVWDRGTNGYNNKKVGGGASDVLVAMGIGQASDIIGKGADAAFAKAPFYGQIGKDKYSHYAALVKVGTDTDGDLTTAIDQSFGDVKVVAVIDARGDFLDEEIAEFTDQKS